MQLFYCPDIEHGARYLNPDESRHCIKVLRKKTGEIIHITDGQGNFFESQLTETSQSKCSVKVLTKSSVRRRDYSVHIAIAPTKSLDRVEWFIEKAVEIGVQKITFIRSGYSEREEIKTDRIRKKAIGAMKQSVRAFLPEIHEMIKLDAFIQSTREKQRFVAHMDEQSASHLKDLAEPSDDLLILIGPEGGFAAEEIELLKNNNFKLVKLGDHRLRTETAGIVACTILANLKY